MRLITGERAELREQWQPRRPARNAAGAFLRRVRAHRGEARHGNHASNPGVQRRSVQRRHAACRVAEQPDSSRVNELVLSERFHGGERVLHMLAEQRPLRITGVEVLHLFQPRATSHLVKSEDRAAHPREREMRRFTAPIARSVARRDRDGMKPDHHRQLHRAALRVGGEIQIARHIVAEVDRAFRQASGDRCAFQQGRGVKLFHAVIARLALRKGRRLTERPEDSFANRVTLLRPDVGDLDLTTHGIDQERAKAVRGKAQWVDGFLVQLLPVAVSRKDGAVRQRERLPPEDAVQPIHLRLDVFHARLVSAGAVAQIQIARLAEQGVNALRRAVGVFDRPDAFHAVVQRRRDQTRPRRDARNELGLIDRQLVLASGEEAQARMQPVGKCAREVLDAFAELRLGEQAIGTRAARAGAAGDDGVHPWIQRRADERRLAVA